ncbi:MAG: 5-(carboxyamino)imidazole ribonucleotide mutase, partial [Chitinophagia bacterium]|nr:5-(carboxyamino)imidazole ribonucleotide mutase [Chitinophagia bacterium]
MKVLIIMGSESDKPIMNESQIWLNWFGIESELVVASAHRNPDLVRELMVNASANGFGAVI